MDDDDLKPLAYYKRIHDHLGFVRVRRGNGNVERDWVLSRTDTAPYGLVIVHRSKPGTADDWQTKKVKLPDLFELNPDLEPG